MGRRILSFVLAMVMFIGIVPFTAYADAEYIQGQWHYMIDDNAAKITAYTGEEKIVNVPETLGNKPVESIAPYTFDNTPAKSINLPLSIKTIEENAFVGPAVKAIYVPKSVESIDENAFKSNAQIFSFEGTLAETFTKAHSLEFIKIASSDHYDSYIGKKVYIDTPHGFTLKALDNKNTVKGRNVTGAKAGNGSVSMTFTCGITAVLNFTVRAVPKAITDLPKIVNLYLTDAKQLTPAISNGDYPINEFSFKSKNTKVAMVSASGKISAVAPGSTTVVVSYSNGISATVPVNVGKVTSQFSLNTKEYMLGVGETKKIAYTIGTDEVVKKIYYTSSNESVATVAANGTIQPLKVGVATITATTNNGLKDSCIVTVGKAPTSIKLAASGVTMGVGEKVKFKVSVNSGAVCSSYLWRIEDESIAKVDDYGNVVGKKAGTTYLYAYTYNYKSKNPYIRTYAKVVVKKAPSSVGFNKSTVVIGLGESFDVNCKLPSGTASYKMTTAYQNDGVISVGKGLVVTGKKLGTAKIIVTAFNGKKGVCTVTVKPAPKKIACKPTSVKLAYHQKYTLKPYVNTGSVCSSYIYKSSDKSVCTVNSNGVVYAKDYGSCYIYIYTYNHTKSNPISCKVKFKVGYITNKLEYYTTYFVATDYGKSNNIKMACKYINGNTDGYILQPGEVFSFNGAVGPRTYSRGFKDGYVISGGEYVPGVGGGICQCATTIFNATLYANLEVVERWEHSLKSSYVPLGRDATVYWGVQDYKFRNDYNTPIRIKMNYDPSGVLNCTIYSLAKINLPKIELPVSYSGGVYTLRRKANGKVNYVAKSKYNN